MSRADGTITVSTDPSNILTGDTILIQGATVTTDIEQITCDGIYTVQSISNKVITVVEEIPTDFDSEHGNTATLKKEILIGNIISTSGNTISLQMPIPSYITLTNSDIISIHTNSSITEYTVSSISTDKKTITCTTSVGEYTPDLPPVKDVTPDPTIKLSVTSVKEEYLDKFPTGDLILDDFAQVQAYLGTFPSANLVIPTQEVANAMYSITPEIYTLSESIHGITTMTCQGLYSEKYKDDNSLQT